MKGSSLNIEKILHDSAEDIDIDRQFKNDLKKRIMASAVLEKKTAARLTHHHKMPYMKVAGWVLFAALSGSTIWGAGSLYSHLAGTHTANQNFADVQQSNSKNQQSNTVSGNVGGVNTIDPGKNVAFADTTINSNVNKPAQTVTTTDSNKNDTKAPVPPSKGTQNQSPAKTNTGSNAGTGAAVQTKPSDTTATGNTASNAGTSTGTTTATEPVKTITLNMEAGRYIIKDISVTGTETVQTLPPELNSLTADECVKVPPSSNGKTVYESGDSVYMISHVDNKPITIDKGSTPVLYAPIGLVSYIKNTAADSSTDTKGSSEVWVFDSNSANKYNLLSSDDGTYSYLNTFWSSDGKALYVLQQNNQTKKYELVKLTLDIQTN